ncbi:MAG: hypothetical protein WBA05_06860 [Gordonia sp. (in: high G+C Gram-positive bacteria)]|uniref:hypothetical protein n=1 Tax=Gordonia TaxID=2053 RepID=UPI0032644AD6
MPYLFVILIVVAAAYLSWRLVQTRLEAEQQHHAGTRPPAPRGPDDDPDFLRTLDQH